MKVDVFGHILPPKHRDIVYQKAHAKLPILESVPSLVDLDLRLRIMDKFDDYVQILTLSSPPIEAIAGPEESPDVAGRANDEMAELVAKYPDRFVGAVAALPLNNIDAALEETDRAIRDLKFKGILIYSNVNGKPIDLPEFLPLYEQMSRYNLPIWIHPTRESAVADYATEDRSKYWLWLIFGLPYETSLAMGRLVFSGVLQSYPNLKFITHHCGAMVPYLEQRIVTQYDLAESRVRSRFTGRLAKPPIEYFRMFYNDTAISGSIAGLMCGYNFFGAEHLLFGTDMPFDSESGEMSIRQTIKSIEGMDIPSFEKKKIFEDNARRIICLPL